MRGDTPRKTVLAALAQWLSLSASVLGFEPGALLAEAGLAPADVADADARIPYDRFIALFRALDERARTVPDAALRLAAVFDLEAIGVVGFAMIHCATVADAYECLSRHQRLLYEESGPTVTLDAARFALWRVIPPEERAFSIQADLTLLATLTMVRQLVGEPARPIEASFQHSQMEASASVEAALGCPITYAADRTLIAFERSVADRPLVRSNPGLVSYLERYVEVVSRALPPSAATTASHVRELMAEMLPREEPRASTVARRMSLSPRTLQRRLKEEGTTFADILDDVRRRLALEHVQRGMAGHDVAFLLAYSEPSAFYRAFRRWTGDTPAAFRKGGGG